MSDNDVQGVKTAALLHDIGKLAVPEHILSKPGPLTPEEFQKIRAHPKVGADIVSSVPLPVSGGAADSEPSRTLGRQGLPGGLKGAEIPLGARILSVVDYFDALMADRPYHKAMSCEAAVGAPAAGGRPRAGSAVVSTFLELLPTLQKRGGGARAGHSPPHADTEAPTLGRPATGSLRAGEEERLRGHRARAPRNLRALRDRPGDGHEPRRRGHDGAHHRQVEQPRTVSRAPRCSSTTRRPTRCAAGSPPARTRTSCSRSRCATARG